MARRSYANERYRKGAEHGSTRRSAAKAKPVRSRGTVAAPERKPKPKPTTDWAGLPTSPAIKRWRRIWWALLLGGIALIVLGWLVPELRAYQGLIAIVALVASALALGIEVLIIRKLRNELLAALKAKKDGSAKHKGDEVRKERA